jgi:DNA-binding CsgD family transcriptional regulator
LVLVAARTGEPSEPPELEPLRSGAGDVLTPGPLSRAAVDELISDEFGAAAVRGLSEACARITGGNPFLLAEALRSLRTQDPDGDGIAALESLDDEPVARWVLPRLHAFGSEATSLAEAISVLGSAPELRIAAALSGVSTDRARELCDRLREAEILAPGRPIGFVHPLVRTAVYLELPEEARSHAHRRAAELMSSPGHPAREIAPHLLACATDGDQWVVQKLRDAAAEAMAAGAPDAARRLLERALEEPADRPAEIRYELGRALWGSSVIEAPEVLVSVAESTDDPDLRLRAIADAAWTYFDSGNLGQAVQWLGRLIEATPADRSEDVLAAEASLFCLETMDAGRRSDASAHIRGVADDGPPTTRGARLVRQAIGFDRFAAGDPVDEVIELAGAFPPPPWAGRGAVPGIATKVVIRCGETDIAREATLAGWEGARSSGLVHVASYEESFLAEIDRAAGRLIDSEAEARTAWDMVREFSPVSLPALVAITNLLSTLIARGQLDEASALAGEWDLSAPFSVIPLTPILLEIRGSLRIATGDLESGAEDLLAVGEDLEAHGFVNPAFAPWRQESVPALVALDRAAEATPIAADGEERARAFGAPHVIGTMLRARSFTEPRDRGIETLRESVTILEGAGPPHELARSKLELGAALRRGGDRSESREPLRQALELAHLSGADGVAERAREELAAAGSRPRSVLRTGVSSLTASELRTAKLAAEGLSNVEIAQRLYVTRKTVEKHLGNAYMKLDISSREELPDALSSAGQPR